MPPMPCMLSYSLAAPVPCMPSCACYVSCPLAALTPIMLCCACMLSWPLAALTPIKLCCACCVSTGDLERQLQRQAAEAAGAEREQQRLGWQLREMLVRVPAPFLPRAPPHHLPVTSTSMLRMLGPT